MTAAVLSNVPFAAGSAIVGAAGRAALWALAQYAKAPLTNTAILALATASLMAGSNALYQQDHRHPSPLFGKPGQMVVAEPLPKPVIPAVRKGKTVVPNVEQQTLTGSVPAPKPAAEPAAAIIGNAEVFEIQRKLTVLGYFDGKVDGFYGPKTAGAIKRFEESHGMKIKGELTREILTAILGASITAEQPKPAQLVAPEPVPDVAPITMTEPVRPAPNLATETIAIVPRAEEPAAQPVALIEPLPEPAPLEATIATAAAPAVRPLPETPQDAWDIATGVANNAVDAAVDVVQGKVQLGPSQPLPPMPEPVAEAAVEEMPAADPVAEIVTAAVSEPEPRISSTDPQLVSRVQQGLANLGFLHGEIDGVAGEATAKAIRNFEVYFNYTVTGRISPELVDMLTDAGAYI